MTNTSGFLQVLNIHITGNLQEDSSIVGLLDKSHLHIIPVLDVDGVSHGEEGDCSGANNQGTTEFHSLSLEVRDH